MFEVGDITAIIEYAMFALFYLMMAQMVILTPFPERWNVANVSVRYSTSRPRSPIT